jgi:hypothetical protein
MIEPDEPWYVEWVKNRRKRMGLVETGNAIYLSPRSGAING